MPFFAIYNASKAAVKMLTETWSYELLPWGVKVSLITPSAFQTGNCYSFTDLNAKYSYNI